MEMITLLLKFIGISAILTILYYVVYAKSAPFFQCRIYLLAVLFISAAVSLSEIKIYPSAIRTVEVHEEAIDTAPISNEYYNSVETEVVPSAPKLTTTLSEEKEVGKTLFVGNNSIFLIYLTVTVLLLIKYLYQLYKIFDITRWGTITTNSKYKLIRNNKVSSPFSYFKNIYINRKLDNETLDVVLQHELCHIEHRHYIDTMIIEFLSIILWFNPFTWIIKRELRDVHEFQVDNSMIRNGLDIPKYQNIIFAELMGYSPNIANGFHNSLIKKRFIMMNQNRTIKHNLLRKLLVLPLVLLLFVLFSFTEKDDVIRYVSIPQAKNIEDNHIDIEETPTVMTSYREQESVKKPELSHPIKPIAMKDTVIVETVVTKTRKSDNDSILQKTVTKNETKYVELSENQLIVSNKKTNALTVKYIEPMADKTLVTVIIPIKGNKHYIEFSSKLGIKNPKTGERFPIIGVMGSTPLDKIISINGMNGRCIEYTMVFPPINEELSFIDICYGSGKYSYVNPTLNEQNRDKNGKLIPYTSSFTFRNLTIDKYKKIDYNYYYLTAEQTPPVQIINRNSGGKLLSVVRTGAETLVTFASKVSFDSQWISFDSGIVLRDCKTKEKYYIKRVEKEIPLNRVCVVKGKKDEFVLYTMVFPRLRNDVDKIDIISTPHINNTPVPQPSVPFNWYGINVKNNKFNPDDKSAFLSKNTHPAARLETTIESKEKPKMILRINNNRLTYLVITLNKNEVIDIPSDFAIRDVVSGKLYRARNATPYNFDIAIGGQKGDKIVLEFENLTYGVDRIDIGVFTKKGEVEHPWSYKNIEINN